MSFWNTKELFQILPFYNVLIEKPKNKHLSSIKSTAFKGYTRSYKLK